MLETSKDFRHGPALDNVRTWAVAAKQERLSRPIEAEDSTGDGFFALGVQRAARLVQHQDGRVLLPDASPRREEAVNVRHEWVERWGHDWPRMVRRAACAFRRRT